MPKLDANLMFMFQEYDMLDRYDAAAKAGFSGVEMQFPYTAPAEQIVERLETNDLKQVIINILVKDPDTGLDNVALRPDRQDLFRERLAQAVDYAKALNCNGVNTGIGESQPGVEGAVMWETLVANQRLAADEFEKIGVKALVEAINTRDKPGFFIHTSKAARKLIAQVNHPNIGMLYDIYHMQVMEGNLAETISANLDLIWHMQLADNPGRHEPGTGEINYEFLLAYIDSIGYQGWVGCEYSPMGETASGLNWAQKWF